MREKLRIGQKLYFVPNHRRENPTEVEVLKVGRKWAELSNHHRIDVQSWLADGGQYISPGQCHETREAYEAERSLDAAWNEVRRKVGAAYLRPISVSLERIEQAMSLLGLSGE